MINLKQHQVTHTGENNFIRDICGALSIISHLMVLIYFFETVNVTVWTFPISYKFVLIHMCRQYFTYTKDVPYYMAACVMFFPWGTKCNLFLRPCVFSILAPPRNQVLTQQRVLKFKPWISEIPFYGYLVSDWINFTVGWHSFLHHGWRKF